VRPPGIGITHFPCSRKIAPAPIFENYPEHLFHKFNNFEKLYLSALSNSKLNIFSESNSSINELFEKYADRLTDSMKLELYKAKYVNLSNLYQYSDALEADRKIINNFASLITPGELDDFKDNADFLEAIKDAPPMQVLQKQDSKIKIFRDLAGLINVPADLSGTEKNFVFDTGANFSVITESLAKKIGLKPGNKKFKCGTATGKKIDASTAISGDFRIGDSQAAATMSQHGIEFVKAIYFLFHFFHGNSHFLCHFQLVGIFVRYKFMQRGIKKADGDTISFHGFKNSFEIFPLIG